MKLNQLYVGKKVKDGDEIVTVLHIYEQQNESPSVDVLVCGDNEFEYLIHHRDLNEI